MPLTLPNSLTNGTNADAAAVQANFDAITAKVDRAFVTSLPGSPVDGQEIYYVADSANGVVWTLKYRSAEAGSYKWYYVGGPPMFAFTDSQETVTQTVQTVAANDPLLTIPLSGDYTVELSAYVVQQSGNAIYIHTKVGAAEGYLPLRLNATNYTETPGHSINKFSGAAAGAAVRTYNRVTAGTGYVGARRLWMIPVRVG